MIKVTWRASGPWERPDVASVLVPDAVRLSLVGDNLVFLEQQPEVDQILLIIPQDRLLSAVPEEPTHA